MSPDHASPDAGTERLVGDAIAAAIRRARVLLIAEALAWGVAAAAVSAAAGALIAVAVVAWRWRSTRRRAIVGLLERTHADSRNLFVTADELTRGTLTATPAIRARVFADAAEQAARLDRRAVLPARRLVGVALLAALAWTTMATAHLWRRGLVPGGAGTLSQSKDAVAPAMRLRVSVAIQPPAYTGLKSTTAVDPEQLQAIEGSALALSIEASAASVSLEHDGQTDALRRGADGRFTDRITVTRTGYLLIVADNGEVAPKPLAKAESRRMMPVVVSPDLLPAVRLAAPGRDLVYAGGNARIVFEARATDDFGLRSLVLRYTKVTGSDENYEFKEGEIPLAVKAASARDWTGTASRSLAELDLKDGDMLVYRAVAADARPGDGSASSDAFFIEISKLGIAAGDAFTLPEEESKYALSQQMLIVKTERLQQRRAALSAGDLTEQAQNLAVEQRMIRAEFVFMLGGEINDEEVEAEQSVELQGGRLQNRGQRDLRAATIAMSQAEKLLTGADTVAALVAERAAVTALQRAFSRDRYILRAMATRTQLDTSRRLTGALADATGWRRVIAIAPENRRAVLLQDVLRGIAELIEVRLKPDTTDAGIPEARLKPGATEAGIPDVRLKPDTTDAGIPEARLKPGATEAGIPDVRVKPDTTEAGIPDVRVKPDTTEVNIPVVSGFSRTRALVLAEEAIRIDPSSAALRQAATELQRAADAADPAARARALASAAAAVADEARRAQTGAPAAPPSVAPALAGAFADAIAARPKGSRSTAQEPPR